jgi:hypothetical protein
MKETITILVKAAPTWSTKYKEYEICTAGITPDGEWRRLYPFPENTIHGEEIHLWDEIKLETSKPSKDKRLESRRIDHTTIEKVGRITDREEKRHILNSITEKSLQNALNEKRSLIAIKPNIIRFFVKENESDIAQLTLEGKPFIKNPYADVDLFYNWKCPEPCEFCSTRPHKMKSFDWGAHVLYKRYQNKQEAVEKVTDMCYRRMKEEFDTWFALGTHSQRPWKKWMIVGLLWMKK